MAEGITDMLSYKVASDLAELTTKVESLMKENHEMIFSVKKMIKDIDEYKKNCDAIKLIGVGASMLGSFFNALSDLSENRETSQSLRNTGNFAETIGNTANIGAQLFDKWKTSELFSKIKDSAQEYGQKSGQLALELEQFQALSTRKNKLAKVEVRGSSLVADRRQVSLIIHNGNMTNVVDKVTELISLMDTSTECHPIVCVLEELLDKLESESRRMDRIHNILSDSMTNPRSSVRRELVNRVEETGTDYARPSHTTSTYTRRFYDHY